MSVVKSKKSLNVPIKNKSPINDFSKSYRGPPISLASASSEDSSVLIEHTSGYEVPVGSSNDKLVIQRRTCDSSSLIFFEIALFSLDHLHLH